ncbi:GNAT family N-acetyltransferase [Actinophytocola sp.]|uniref:GNAT family N-acetyltransferase n=1 Tax=Actinophytocola sp. TaxID=1872138 RepID=UPI0039C85B69
MSHRVRSATVRHLRTGRCRGRRGRLPARYLGIDLVPAAWGRGLGGTAGTLLTRYLFDTTEIDRVPAFTDVDNVPGWRALDKSGFHREGVLRGVTKRGGSAGTWSSTACCAPTWTDETGLTS